MPRISLLDWNGGEPRGLWISGPRERTPRTHLRRYTAPHQIREREIRTRNGTTVDASIAAAHSLGRFDDVRFQGADASLFRAGVSIDTGYDGTPLDFVVSEPRVGTDAEYLFVCGGGKLVKVEDDGTVSQWGIDPPTGGGWSATGGVGEDSSETTVVDPQEKTIADTTSTTGWFGSPAPFQSTVDVDSPSGSAICQTFVAEESEDLVDLEEDGLI